MKPQKIPKATTRLPAALTQPRQESSLWCSTCSWDSIGHERDADGGVGDPGPRVSAGPGRAMKDRDVVYVPPRTARA